MHVEDGVIYDELEPIVTDKYVIYGHKPRHTPEEHEMWRKRREDAARALLIAEERRKNREKEALKNGG